MASTSTKIGHGLARALGIKLDYRNELSADKITRGESVFSVSSADSYVEEEPTVGEWLYSMTPSFGDMGRYLYSLFPFTHWLPFYNLQWLAGDLVAGKRRKSIQSSGPKLTLNVQESQLELLLFHKVWHTPSWHNSQSSTVSTLPLWVFSFTGSLLHPKTLPSVQSRSCPPSPETLS